MKFALTLMMVMMFCVVIGCESTEKAETEEVAPPASASSNERAVVETSGVEPVGSSSTSTEVIYVEPTTTTAPTTTSTPQSTAFPGPQPHGIPMGPGPVLDNAQPGGAYIIKKGDTLFSIAKRVYGDGSKWREIQAANPGIVPTKLRIGQQITLPR